MTSPGRFSEGSPFAAVAGGVEARVRVIPKGGRTAIDGVVCEADGAAVLKVRLAVPPEGGKANAALIRLLAKAWRLPPSRLALAAGQKARRKTVRVSGSGEALLAQLEEWRKTHHV